MWTLIIAGKTPLVDIPFPLRFGDLPTKGSCGFRSASILQSVYWTCVPITMELSITFRGETI